MAKKAISVTLHAENLTWLKGRAGTAGVRSVSELLDRIITEARGSGRVSPARSVVGTIDIDPSDPLLEHANADVRYIVDTSLRRPLRVKETTPAYGPPPRRAKKRRG